VIIWILIAMSGVQDTQTKLFVRVFDSKQKCEKKLSKLEGYNIKACFKGEVQK